MMLAQFPIQARRLSVRASGFRLPWVFVLVSRQRLDKTRTSAELPSTSRILLMAVFRL
jgi:hypothetical protein